jgi:hypothetical protein
MERFSQAVSGLFKSKPDTNQRTYTRSEESSYVYKLNPDGKGATVATTVNGTYSFNKHHEGKVSQLDEGHMAGIFGGELDEKGRIIKGGYQKWMKEGDTEKMELRGTVDPTMYAEQVGLTKPTALKSHAFDPAKASKHLGNDNIDMLMDELATTEEFMKDPVMMHKVVQKPRTLEAS